MVYPPPDDYDDSGIDGLDPARIEGEEEEITFARGVPFPDILLYRKEGVPLTEKEAQLMDDLIERVKERQNREGFYVTVTSPKDEDNRPQKGERLQVTKLAKQGSEIVFEFSSSHSARVTHSGPDARLPQEGEWVEVLDTYRQGNELILWLINTTWDFQEPNFIELLG